MKAQVDTGLSSGHSAKECFHCGESLPQGANITVTVNGRKHSVCSERCRQTAEWIEQTGLADFYKLRSSPSAHPAAETDNSAWDIPELQRHVVKKEMPHKFEVSLMIDGMHCAGCAWLIERALIQLGGVSDIQINPVTHRARMTFDDTQVTLTAILDTLVQAGYQPRPLETASLDDAREKENRDLLKRILVAGFGMMQVMCFAFIIYMENFHPLPGGTKPLFRWLGFLVATPVVFYAALPFFRGARQALRLKTLNMDVPIAIAIAAIYAVSVFQVLSFQGEVYFDSVSMLVFFLLTGRYLEMRARHRSVDSADALVHLTPTFAERRRQDGTLERVAVVELQAGDRIQVAEGSHLPADGQLIIESALLDESLLSGESSPRRRFHNDTVIAGSLVLEGPVEVLVTKVGTDTFLSKLSNLSTKAQTERPKLASQSKAATSRFVRRVLIFTAITLVGWLWYDPSQALIATIAVLVVACPCALGLAAPAAITRALGVLAKRNILVVHPDALDTFTKIDRAVFDKTGTLTEPSLDTHNIDAATLQLAASLARESQHPLSRALVSANQLPILAVKSVRSFPGLGLEGQIQEKKLRLGQPKFVLDKQALDNCPAASLVLGESGKLLAAFHMQETLRNDAAATLEALGKAQIKCEILSGDSPERVRHIATQLAGIKHHGRLLPDAKLAHIKQHHDQGHCILAVGDGSNDAPILGGADISVALTSGAELAQANADILLCSGQLSGLVDVRHIAQETRRILRQNERWAIGYNTLAMPLAALGFIPPWLAAICMSISSLVVVINALRIGRQPPKAAAVTVEKTQNSTDPCCCHGDTEAPEPEQCCKKKKHTGEAA